MFEMKEKKKKNENKRKHPEFLHKQEEKRPFNNLTINKTSRWGVFFSKSLILLINVFQNSNIFAGKFPKQGQFKT